MNYSRSARINLGIAIAHATCMPGQVRTLQDIADFADCKRQNIQQIEARALRRIRPALIQIAKELGLR